MPSAAFGFPEGPTPFHDTTDSITLYQTSNGKSIFLGAPPGRGAFLTHAIRPSSPPSDQWRHRRR